MRGNAFQESDKLNIKKCRQNGEWSRKQQSVSVQLERQNKGSEMQKSHSSLNSQYWNGKVNIWRQPVCESWDWKGKETTQRQHLFKPRWSVWRNITWGQKKKKSQPCRKLEKRELEGRNRSGPNNELERTDLKGLHLHYGLSSLKLMREGRWCRDGFVQGSLPIIACGDEHSWQEMGGNTPSTHCIQSEEGACRMNIGDHKWEKKGGKVGMALYSQKSQAVQESQQSDSVFPMSECAYSVSTSR